ncbi:MAG: hypothetical protein ACPGFA_02840 [Pikeienuella sp.]
MPSPPASTDTETGDKFVITLNATENGALYVQSVEFIAGFARTRISLSKLNRLDEFFCPEVAAELTDILKPALLSHGMLSLPDRSIRMSDILLEGCRVMVMAAAGGGENIIVRFRKCYGAIFSILNDQVPLKKNLADKTVSQALEMLENAYIPLFDLSRYLDGILDTGDQGLDQNFENAASTINEKIKSLEMYRFFLMRYLETQGVGGKSLEDFARNQLQELSGPPAA